MSDTFRQTYRSLSAAESKRILDIKAKAQELHDMLHAPMPLPGELIVPGLREFALARTKLEECVMWATKAIA